MILFSIKIHCPPSDPLLGREKSNQAGKILALKFYRGVLREIYSASSSKAGSMGCIKINEII